MGERMVSGFGCNDPSCKEHGRGQTPCESRAAFVALVHGRRINKARAKYDEQGNIEALELLLDDGQILCIDPEVSHDRIYVSMVNER